MRGYILTKKEKEVLQAFIENPNQVKSTHLRVLFSYIRRDYETLKGDMRLIDAVVATLAKVKI